MTPTTRSHSRQPTLAQFKQGTGDAYRIEVLKDVLAGNNKTFAARLRKARKAAKLSQIELAKLCGIHQPVISALESGQYLSTKVVDKLAVSLNVTINWLLKGDVQPAKTGDKKRTGRPPRSKQTAITPKEKF